MTFEVGARIDGKFNLWKLKTEFNETDGFTEYWMILSVFNSAAEAQECCFNHQKHFQKPNKDLACHTTPPRKSGATSNVI
jgi:hypothetical protein